MAKQKLRLLTPFLILSWLSAVPLRAEEPKEESSSQASGSSEELDNLNRSHSRHRFALGVNYVNSRWSELSSALKDGSLGWHFEFSTEWCKNWDVGLAMDFLGGYSVTRSEENVNALTVSWEGRYMFSSGALRPYAGMGIHFGAYRAWNLASETDTSISYDKHGSGGLIGLEPQLGIRLFFNRFIHTDIRTAYLAFANGTAASKIGGLYIGASLGFSKY